ncbi:MAG TPA: MYXO-CTERM sorting domain-containing protein [Polyangiaceae bacterium]|nr:MYXO-CTERM sorting domain-containing protein [Polyangiaceae bacterium]
MRALKITAVPALALALLVAGPRLASAGVEPPTDCPPGSTGKASGSFAWCEPSVCLHDGNCTPGEVCRPVPLCVEVGTLSDAGAAGEERLAATQRCGPGGACPSSQTCSVKDRCISKLAAQKLGLLDAPAPASAPSAPSTEPPKKSACGCDVVGRGPAPTTALGLAALGLAAAVARRSRRKTP